MTIYLFKGVCVAVSLAVCITFSGLAIAETQTELSVPKLGRMVSDASWCLRLPKESAISYSGVVSFDNAGTNSQSMLYPAPGGVAGFLVSVITHSVLVESAKKSQKDKFQLEADKVLLPYQEILNHYTHKDLMQSGLEKIVVGGSKRLIASADKVETEWYIESAPMFSLTQDQSALILENEISIYATHTPTVPAYQNTARVVSAGQQSATPNYWASNQGDRLKDESARLFAESLSMVFNDVAADTAREGNPHKTVRYLEGANEKMERGKIISEQCNRIVFKTLRGWLMSVPDRRSPSTPGSQCDDKANKRFSLTP